MDSILIKILLVINLIYTAFILVLFFTLVIPKYFRLKQAKPRPAAKLITTIVPLKNGGAQILDNIKNLLEQQPFENSRVMVSIEDESEPLYEYIKQLESDYPALKLIIAGHPGRFNGKASNMAAAYENTESDIVVFMDADVLVTREVYYDLVNKLQEPDAGGAFAPAFYLFSKRTGGNVIRGITNYFFDESVIMFEKIISLNYCAGAFMGFNKTALDSSGGVKAVLDYISDDAMLGYNVHKSGFKIKLLDSPVFMPPETLSLKQSGVHLVKWLVIVRRTMGFRYLFLPGAFYTGIPVITVIAALTTGENVNLSLILLIFVGVFRIISAAAQDKIVAGKHSTLAVYLFTAAAGYIQLFVWLYGFFPAALKWGGRRYRIGKRGRIISSADVKQ